MSAFQGAPAAALGPLAEALEGVRPAVLTDARFVLERAAERVERAAQRTDRRAALLSEAELPAADRARWGRIAEEERATAASWRAVAQLLAALADLDADVLLQLRVALLSLGLSSQAVTLAGAGVAP